MKTIFPLLFGVLIIGVEKSFVYAECSDCIFLRFCQAAKDYYVQSANSSSKFDKKLNESYCGLGEINGAAVPKVCCSKFNTFSDRWGNPEDETEDSIVSHPNIDLLPKSCGSIDGDRIFGGKVANIYEFPWMTLISQKTREGGRPKFVCGGSIINSKYILTAAHCVQNKVIAGVRVGDFDISSKKDCQGEYPYVVCESQIQDLAVEESIVHENYQKESFDNDIALLRVKRPIRMLKNAKPICLPAAKELRQLDVTSGSLTGTVAGWGLTETGSEFELLNKVTIPILSAATCREAYNVKSSTYDMTLRKLCAGEYNKDSCNGDSGGPLMIEDEVDGVYRMIQYGIVSFGPKQCGSSFPGVYTDVRKYMKWILDHIKA